MKLASITMSDDVSTGTIDAVRGITKRICPLDCTRGQHAEKETCVANAPPEHDAEPRRSTEAPPEHDAKPRRSTDGRRALRRASSRLSQQLGFRRRKPASIVFVSITRAEVERAVERAGACLSAPRLGSTWEKPRRYALKTGERRSLKTLGFLRNRLLYRQAVLATTGRRAETYRPIHIRMVSAI